MKKYILSALFLISAGIQTLWAQGFRVYKSDGIVAQFSLRTDSIVFYDGLGTDVEFGPFTPVNQMIIGTWYKSKSESITFNEDGTTDYIEGATYEFMPYQGNVVIYNAYGAPVNYFKILKVTAEKMIVSTHDDNSLIEWSTTQPLQLVEEIVLSETSLVFMLDETKILSATVLPKDAANSAVAWESDNEAVSTVNAAGLVTAVAVGTCTITCHATDGSNIYAKCEIVVKDNDNTHGFTNGHEWVDLGLPSGTLWATCNVGASNPDEYGDYFAWGEMEIKDDYGWSTYLHCYGTSDSMKKYCTNSEYGYYGFIDNLTELESVDDAATANWGDEWQMPSKEQLSELISYKYTITEYKTLNGINGRLISSKSNGRSVFLPAAGYLGSGNWSGNVGYGGYYWSHSLVYAPDAWGLYFFPSDIYVTGSKRNYGHSIRPVRKQYR